MFDLLVVLTILSLANLTHGKVSTSEVTYSVSTDPDSINQNFVTPIDKMKIKKQHPVTFIIHGMGDNGNLSWVQNLTEVLLKNNVSTVVVVDWRKLAQYHYPKVLKYTQEVGVIVGDVIINLVEEKLVFLDDLHIIGLSLGAHVAGFAGKKVKRKFGSPVSWITGLDPAGPYYQKVFKSKRLSNDDAQVVEVIHTDAGFYGFPRSLGTIDFYPNGGALIQPFCEISNANAKEKIHNLFSCSHQKSWQYYTIALKSGRYEATKCDSWMNYKKGLCDNNEKVIFGSFKPPKQKGDYYLEIQGPLIDVIN